MDNKKTPASLRSKSPLTQGVCLYFLQNLADKNLMNSKAIWAESLGLSQDQLNQMEAVIPEGTSLISWCLDNKIIDAEKYLDWARNYYQLPSVQAEMGNNPPPLELMGQYRKPHWPDHIYPLSFWENTLYLGCLEPCPEINLEIPHQWLLLPFSVIHSWKTGITPALEISISKSENSVYESVGAEAPTTISSVSQLPEEEVPTPIVPENSGEFVAPLPEMTVVTEVSYPAIAPIAPEPVAVAEPAPAASSEPPPAPTLTPPALPKAPGARPAPLTPTKLSAPTPAVPKAAPIVPPSAPPPPPARSSQETPRPTATGLKPKVPSAPSGILTKFSNPIGKNTPTPAPGTAPRPSTPGAPQPLKAVPTPKINSVQGLVSKSSAHADSLTQSLKTPTPIKKVSFNDGQSQIIKTFTGTPTASKVMKLKTVEIADEDKSLSKKSAVKSRPEESLNPNQLAMVLLSDDLLIKNANEVKTLVDIPYYALGKMREHFDKTMILMFMKGQLSVWRWDERWNYRQGQSQAVDLTQRSLFKIVFDTKLPYHGYIVSSPVNDAFFKTWNLGALPEHITVTPLNVNNKLLGMFLGVTTKAKSARVKLEDIENITNESARLIFKIKDIEAA